MNNMKTKSNLTKKLVIGALALGSIFNSCNNSHRIIEVVDTFRGYHNDFSEGRQILVFDDKLKEARTSPKETNLRLYGNNADTLKLNKDYLIGYIPSRVGDHGRVAYLKEK